MSKQHTIQLTCPVCGKISDFCVTDSADLDTDADNISVMELTAFCHTCPNCKKAFPVRFPMLCISRRLSLAALLLTDRSQLDQLGENVRPGSGFRLRAVLSPDRLRELILINRCGLDDRAMMLLEIAMKRMMTDNKVDVSELFFTGVESLDTGKILLFHAVLKDGTAKKASWPVDFYHKMRSEFTEELPEPGRYMIFDEAWAAGFIR